jgi:(2Fe-2S) ferredoxin
MQDLTQAREEALERRRASQQGYTVSVGLGSCGLAVGAGEVMEAIRQTIASVELPPIRLIQIGCIGLCALEPIVQVQAPNQPLVTYGKVTPEAARQILSQHIGKGLVAHEFVIESL